MLYSTPMDGSPHAKHWTLDPEVTFLNHGSFGACPRVVLEAQCELQARIEREPVTFLLRELEWRLDEARAELARFVGADMRDLAFVSNATAGVNAVLRSLEFKPGDELLTADQEYGACRNTLGYVAQRSGAKVVVANIPFPIDDGGRVVSAFLERVTPRTKLVMVSHVTSPTGLIYPVERVVREMADRGIDVLVDGAHAPVMVPLNLDELGAAYYTGNCHKWMCAPKGAGFLHVRRDKQGGIHPAVISHGHTTPRSDRSRFLLEFDWTGTMDPTPALCVPHAIRFIETLIPGGVAVLREHNRSLALQARAMLCETLGVKPPSPESMIGSLAAVPLPDGDGKVRVEKPKRASMGAIDRLQDELWDRYKIEVPVMPWPAPPRRLLRVSAQAYNSPGDYEKLCTALRELL